MIITKDFVQVILVFIITISIILWTISCEDIDIEQPTYTALRYQSYGWFILHA